jgi:hypothetical protein
MNNENKIQNSLFHFLKRVGYIILIISLSTTFFKWLFRDDASGSIIGDNSDWNIIFINAGIIFVYLLFIMGEAILLHQKEKLKLRNVNIGIILIAALFIFLILIS